MKQILVTLQSDRLVTYTYIQRVEILDKGAEER